MVTTTSGISKMMPVVDQQLYTISDTEKLNKCCNSGV